MKPMMLRNFALPASLIRNAPHCVWLSASHNACIASRETFTSACRIQIHSAFAPAIAAAICCPRPFGARMNVISPSSRKSYSESSPQLTTICANDPALKSLRRSLSGIASLKTGMTTQTLSSWTAGRVVTVVNQLRARSIDAQEYVGFHKSTLDKEHEAVAS